MITTVLLYSAASIGIFTALVIFSPIYAKLCINFKELRPSGTAYFSFLHPWFISVSIDFNRDTTHIRIFNILLNRKISKPTIPIGKKQLENFAGEFDSTEIPTATLKEAVELTEKAPDERASPSLSTTTQTVRQTHKNEVASSGTENEPLQDKSLLSVDSNFTSRPFGKSHMEETMASKDKKRDNWFKRLKRNKYLFFIRNSSWRNKIIKVLLRFLHSLLFLVRFDHLQIFIKAGVDNPMITGSITGFFIAVISILSNNKNHSFRFEPVFMNNHFESSLSFKAGTSLFKLLLPVLSILFTFPYLYTLIIWWRYLRLKKRQQQLAAA